MTHVLSCAVLYVNIVTVNGTVQNSVREQTAGCPQHQHSAAVLHRPTSQRKKHVDRLQDGDRFDDSAQTSVVCSTGLLAIRHYYHPRIWLWRYVLSRLCVCVCVCMFVLFVL